MQSINIFFTIIDARSELDGCLTLVNTKPIFNTKYEITIGTLLYRGKDDNYDIQNFYFHTSRLKNLFLSMAILNLLAFVLTPRSVHYLKRQLRTYRVRGALIS